MKYIQILDDTKLLSINYSRVFNKHIKRSYENSIIFLAAHFNNYTFTCWCQENNITEFKCHGPHDYMFELSETDFIFFKLQNDNNGV